MNEARQIHLERELRDAGLEPTAEEVELAARVARVREALDDLEGELARNADRGTRPGRSAPLRLQRHG
jgi:hypothetical protein